MKMNSLKIALLICICMLKLISFVNSEKSELEKIKEVFSKRLLKEIGSHLRKSNRTDTKCIKDIGLWYSALKSQKSLWSFQMLDSWGKIPAGIFTLNINSLGQFDECINIEHSRIKGKYCLADFTFDPALIGFTKNSNVSEKGIQSPELIDQFFIDGLIHYKNGICFPKSCKSVEMENLLESIFNVFDVKLNFTIDEENCETNDPVVWKNIDWVAFAIFMFVALLVITSTIYDSVIQFWIKKERSGRFYDLMISFSVRNNMKKMISANESPKNLRCLNGLRFTSVLWVLLVHRCNIIRLAPMTNITDIPIMLQKNSAWIFLAANFSVDTFLVLSGLLMSYTTFNRSKNGESFNVFSFYRHRFVRVVPALAAMLLFCVSFFVYMGDGPIWKSVFVKPEVSKCETSWWATLLFINNYHNIVEMCMEHTWYLSSDMHLYLLSPILIYSILHWKRAGWIHTAFWILVLQIIQYGIAYHDFFRASILPLNIDKRKFYYRTHTRAIPWLIGFLFGYFLHLKSGSKLKINKVVVMILWILSLTTMCVLVFSTVHMQNFDRVVNHVEDTSYVAFSRNVWALCISWIIIACTHGYGGPINWWLSLRIWEIMGKLAFCIYLVHIQTLHINAGVLRNPLYGSFFELFKAYFSDVIIAIMVACILKMSIEQPFINLESVIFPRKKKARCIEIKLSTPAAVENLSKSL